MMPRAQVPSNRATPVRCPRPRWAQGKEITNRPAATEDANVILVVKKERRVKIEGVLDEECCKTTVPITADYIMGNGVIKGPAEAGGRWLGGASPSSGGTKSWRPLRAAR